MARNLVPQFCPPDPHPPAFAEFHSNQNFRVAHDGLNNDNCSKKYHLNGYESYHVRVERDISL